MKTEKSRRRALKIFPGNIPGWRHLVLMAAVGGVLPYAHTDEEAFIQPRQIQVALERNVVTQFSLGVVPDRGVRLIFPFIFDELPAHYPGTARLLTRMSNADVFAFSEPKIVEGQNVLLISVNTDAIEPDYSYVGDAQISVAGFSVTISLYTISDLDRHVTDVLFVLNESTRDYLIDEVIAREKSRLQREYETLLAEQDERVLLKAQALLARAYEDAEDYVETYRLYERKRLEHPTGEPLTVSARAIKKYSPGIFVLSLVIHNPSNTNFVLRNMRVSYADSGEEVAGGWGCEDALLAPKKTVSCPFATQSETFWEQRKEAIVLRLETDLGVLELTL